MLRIYIYIYIYIYITYICVPSLVEIAPGVPELCSNIHTATEGNPVASDETVIYGYESSSTLATDRLHYKL
jgi:hypothetical protein